MTIDSLDPSTGGPARSVPSLGEAVSNSGARVHFFVNKGLGGVRQLENPCQSVIPVKSLKNLGKTLRELNESQLKGSLIHNHGIWLPINHYASTVAQRCNLPLVVTPRGMLEPWARSYRAWKKKMAWYLYQRRDLKAASVLHATSEKESSNLQSLGFHIPIAMIPNGVVIPPFINRAEKVSQKKIALFLGRIHPVKGLVNLVKAWSIVRPRDWQVVIAGPDTNGHKAEVYREIIKYGLADTFTFIGPVNDIEKHDLFNKADLFILPTYTENFGMAVAEALASGVPVITTKGAPWSELDEYNCGWWVDIGIEPLSLALKQAINLSHHELSAMGQRGRKMVEQNYSWDKIGKDMISVYEWVVGGGIMPGCMVVN